MYNIYSSIINRSLYAWAEEYGNIDEAQAGCRQGHSAIDTIFSLQAMAQKYLSRPGGACIVCM
jgi:hypothetical protein